MTTEIIASDSNLRPTCNVPGTAEVVLDLLQLPQSSAILDLGCYHGAMSYALLAQGHDVTSCDLIPWEGAKTLPRFQVVDANHDLPFGNAAFDAIVCTDVIEHLENPALLMRECARILKPAGVLILSTPDISNCYSRVMYALRGEFPLFQAKEFCEWNHISPVSASWLQFTAQKVGLRIEVTRPEAGRLGRRRRLMLTVLYPFFYLVARHQMGALNFGTTLIVRLRKI